MKSNQYKDGVSESYNSVNNKDQEFDEFNEDMVNENKQNEENVINSKKVS